MPPYNGVSNVVLAKYSQKPLVTEGSQGPFQNDISKGENFMNTSTTNEKETPQSRIYTVNDIAAILGIGRASADKLANSGLFKTIRISNMIRISRKSFEDWLKTKGLDDEVE